MRFLVEPFFFGLFWVVKEKVDISMLPDGEQFTYYYRIKTIHLTREGADNSEVR